MRLKSILTILLGLVLTSGLYAQGGGSISAADARTTGLAKTYTAVSRGVYSIGRNPANLAIEQDHKFEISTVLPLPNMTIRSGFDFMSIDDYNYYFGWNGDYNAEGEKIGRKWTQEDKEDFYALFDDGGKIIADVFIPYFAISYNAGEKIGAFAFSIGDVISANVSLPSTFAELALNGNEIGRVYDFGDTEGSAWALRKYTLSYARSMDFIEQNIFKNLYFGVSLHMVQGFAYAEIERMNTELMVTDNNIITGMGDYRLNMALSPAFGMSYDFDETTDNRESDMGPFPETAGSGFGFDIGFGAELDNVWSFGLALTDVGGITWDTEAVVYESNSPLYLDDLLEEDQRNAFVDSISAEGRYISEHSTGLPTALRLGVAMQLDKFLKGNFPGTMLLAFDYNQGFNNMPGNSMKPRFSVGAEWKPGDYIPYIRTGFSFGGRDVFGWAFGIGVQAGPLEFNIASQDFQYVFTPNAARRVSIALGSRWIF